MLLSPEVFNLAAKKPIAVLLEAVFALSASGPMAMFPLPEMFS